MEENLDRNSIIVSLTSYPARIGNVHKVIKTLLIQNKKPDKIILWLATTEFPDKEKNLPKQLVDLCEYGVTIRWCEDLKSHKKYFFAMQEFKEEIIITVDDDIYYSPRMVELLYNSYIKFPDSVSCLRANRIGLDEDGEIIPYDKWDKAYVECVNEPVMDLLPVGMGGVLYPPHCLPNDTFNIENIKELCLNQDDLWLRAMEIKNKIPVVVVKYSGELTQFIEESQAVGLHTSVNVIGNDISIKKLSIKFFSGNTAGYKNLGQLFEGTNTTIKSCLNKKKNREKNIFSQMEHCRKVVIYGAGEGARAVYKSLKYHYSNLEPYCFIVTDKKGNDDKIFGIPVKSVYEIENFKNDIFILVSTAEKYQEEIRALLMQLKFKCVWYVRDKIMNYLVNSEKYYQEANQEFLVSCISENEVSEKDK